ncbi:hypothetical protein Syun_014463 [Stephania yunnanensis]|uniref:Uncharacterized protein n=1 Tax=Stephania yunnanensis TaxID=152371 RepID=A0AAP0JJE0_9MAGN
MREKMRIQKGVQLVEKKRGMEREKNRLREREKKRGLEKENRGFLIGVTGERIRGIFWGRRRGGWRGRKRGRGIVEEATDDPSRPILGGPTDQPILASFNNYVAVAIWKNDRVRQAVDVVHKWKALSASESTMTSAEKMANDVLRHLTGKGSSISSAFEEGTQSGSHTVGDDFE